MTMLIRELMTPSPAVLTPRTTMPEALKLMNEKKLHRMPVVDDRGVLVARITVETLMVKDVVTVTENTPVEDAARMMADRNIGCLPVMRDGKLVGMVNQNDMFRAFMELLGGRRHGVRIWATTSSEKGTVAQITKAVASVSGDLAGLGLMEIHDAKGARTELTLKVQDVTRDKLVAAVKPYVYELLDVREI
jgi:acetoin utilization protein AcuB